MTTVSVVIPTWNRATCLEKAIRSALYQTYPPLEVLVCEDGSTDDTEQVVRLINDPRVIWLPGEHSGRPAVPRNRGVRQSRGEWVAFLDDDDVWLPEKLEWQMKNVQLTGCKASCSDAYRFIPDEGRRGRLLGIATDFLVFNDLLTVNLVICSSVMVSKDALKMAGGFPEDQLLTAIEDYALWLRLSTLTNFSVVTLPLLDYRDTPRQSIRAKGFGWQEQQCAVLDDFCAWSEHRRDGFFERASEVRNALKKKKSLLSRCTDFFHGAFERG